MPATIDPADRRLKIALAQIKSKQSDTAADINERLRRIPEQLESRRKNRNHYR